MRKNKKNQYTIQNSTQANNKNFITIEHEISRSYVKLTQADYYNAPDFEPKREVNILHFPLSSYLEKHDYVYCYEILEDNAAHFVLPSQVPSIYELIAI